MKFETPASNNPTDRLYVIGKPVDRIDGPFKVSGVATYAHEQHSSAANQVHGYIVGSAIATGRIGRIDTTEALSMPGVLGVVTHENAGVLNYSTFCVKTTPLAGPEVAHYHQAVAIVVAETFETARAAASCLHIDYTVRPGKFDLASEKDTAPLAPPHRGPPKIEIGDFETAFREAFVQLDRTYTTPDQTHAMLEPHATLAAWSGDKLTCWTSLQNLDWGASDLARTLGIPKENVRLVSPYIGGGFGGKAFILGDIVLAACAARMTGRPVKVALQRHLIINNTTHRSATIQRVRLGAQQDGTITSIGHDSWCGNVVDGLPESATEPTRAMYASPNRLLRSFMAPLDLPEAGQLRAPCEVPGMMALEIAMDELAEKLQMDPIELRIKNDARVHPEDPDRPFSKRQLIECFREGARLFRWDRRNHRAGMTREGHWFVGYGVAGAIRASLVFPSAARLRLDRHGVVTVETDMTDIGTGSYTIIGQTVAEMMGTSMDKVVVNLGDSAFPTSCGSFGQVGAASSTAGVYAACVRLRELIAPRLGFNSDDLDFIDGNVRVGNRSFPLGYAARDGELVAEDIMEYGDLSRDYAQSTFGATFSEVAVDVYTGEIRVRRMLMVCAAGRILNPKTARSQIIGAMTMGTGAALMEKLDVDRRSGFFVNHDLAGYEVPVNADIGQQDVVFLDEVDPTSTPLKAKGVGELGIVGAAPAIANAFYNATGVRIRDFPITVDKYIEKLPNFHG